MKIRRHGSAAAVVSAALVLAACGQTGRPAARPPGSSSNGGFTIGVLMPDNNATRYQTFDRPFIEKKVEELCPACTVKYANAQGDASTQRHQLNAMLINGARVLILDPVDAGALRRSVGQARDAGVPVVAYDRLADGPISGFSAYDNAVTGRLQAEALLQGMGKRAHNGEVVWLVPPTPSLPTSFPVESKVALPLLKSQGVRIDEEHGITTPVPNAQNAAAAMAAAIAGLGPHRIAGVYAIDDVVAAGAVSALKAAQVTSLPPIVAQDAELSAVQRIVKGEQYMTVYKPYEPEAGAAAAMAVALGRGEKLDGIARSTVDNLTTKDIPAVLLTPVPVTAKSVKATVVEGGTYTVEQICTPKLTSACRKAGLI
ncbi:substrate-binding domain-containing protein [Streptomyces sp. Ru71]|uniref:substrate-binding domain-containing protein n=1 Tax=Streptomyces sp. Ru71 TaxID=2080746 RepID=UPI0021566681|nr:substrate-binding domain-containing protein [Streptomyces sp. Ru71]